MKIDVHIVYAQWPAIRIISPVMVCNCARLKRESGSDGGERK